MFTLDDLRAQVQTHNYIAMRDLPKRFVTVQIVLGSQWFVGMPWVALGNFLWIVVIELVIYWLIRTTPDVTQISRRRIAALLVSSHIACIGYFGAGLVLTLQPDLGIFVGGICWILAAVMTTLMMFSATLAFYVGAALAGFPIAMTAVVMGFFVPLQPMVTLTWLSPTAAVLLFIINTVQGLWEFRDTHRELRTTRTELLRNLRKMKHMSLHDGLTGLPNRAAFTADLAGALGGASAANPVAVMMIDLNGFKPVNDSFGHDAGDAILVAVAERLGARVGAPHRAYRLGGDEFAVLARGLAAEAEAPFGERLAAEIRKPVPYREKVLTVGASIGVASARVPGLTSDTLCAQADQAMYLAKADPDRSTLQFDPGMVADLISAERRRELADVIHRRGIVAGYQGRFRADGVGLVGLEALARWPHPEQGLLRAETFLPELEEAGLLPELTHLMLRQVLDHVSLWRAAGADPGRVSVNIPPAVLATQTGREDLDWLLAQYPDATAHLAIEVTEEVYTGRASAIVLEALERLRARGIEIYLDDFGTGFGSYRHLRSFTPDQVKIDGSLVAGLSRGPEGEQVVAGFIAMARSIGAGVVAEQVETEAQRACLERLGCDQIEGWHLGGELTPEMVQTLLLQEQRPIPGAAVAGRGRRAWRDR